MRNNFPPGVPRAQIPDRPDSEADLSRWFMRAGFGPIPDYFKRDWRDHGHPPLEMELAQ